MIIGTVKEIKTHEYRVGLTPASVLQYVKAGHRVLVEKDAGLESGFSNEAYMISGAIIIDQAKDVWKDAEMIVKVKEPLKEEYPFLKKVYYFIHFCI